jgi:hypothetical protein
MTPHKTIRTENFILWTALQSRIAQRSEHNGSTTVTWVKGHSANQGNNLSDKLASLHGPSSTQYTNTFSLPTNIETGLTLTPTIFRVRIETDLRKAINHFNSTMVAYSSLFSTWHQTHNLITPGNEQTIEVDWNRTLRILHNSFKMTSLFTTRKISTFRSYQMKLFNGTLPTIDALNRRSHHIYANDTCKVCNAASEDNEHLWTCPEHTEIISDILRQAIDIIVKPLKPLFDVYPQKREALQSILNIFRPFDDKTYDRNVVRAAFTNLIRLTYIEYTEEQITKFVADCELIQKQHLIRAIVPTQLSAVLRLFADNAMLIPGLRGTLKRTLLNYIQRETSKHSVNMAIKHINECFAKI